jgi:hypothetical protein
MRIIDRRSRWLGICLLVMAGCLAGLSLLGALVTSVIQWRIRPDDSQPAPRPRRRLADRLSPRSRRSPQRRRCAGRPMGALLGFAPAAYAV